MTDSSNATVRMRVIYTGRVQGVCFRATAQDLSHDHDVVGWVRNSADGSVELEAEGPQAAVEAFLAAVGHHFNGYIRDEQRTVLPAGSSETRFEIRY